MAKKKEIKEEDTFSLSLSPHTPCLCMHKPRKDHVRTYQDSHLQARKRALTKTELAGTLILGFPDRSELGEFPVKQLSPATHGISYMHSFQE